MMMRNVTCCIEIKSQRNLQSKAKSVSLTFSHRYYFFLWPVKLFAGTMTCSFSGSCTFPKWFGFEKRGKYIWTENKHQQNQHSQDDRLSYSSYLHSVVIGYLSRQFHCRLYYVIESWIVKEEYKCLGKPAEVKHPKPTTINDKCG